MDDFQSYDAEKRTIGHDFYNAIGQEICKSTGVPIVSVYTKICSAMIDIVQEPGHLAVGFLRFWHGDALLPADAYPISHFCAVDCDYCKLL